MRRVIILIVLIFIIVTPARAMEFTAPPAPESAQTYMPPEHRSFGEDLWFVIKAAISNIAPKIPDASRICVSLIAIILLTAILQNFTGITKRAVDLVGVICVTSLMIQPSGTLIQLGLRTVEELSEYGKLFLPVMTAALAAQGGATTSAALYTGTVVFNSILSTGISKLIIPLIFIYIAVSVAVCAIDENLLNRIKDFVKWLMTWLLKISIYLFTGYIGITGVVSGTADAAAVKAAKLALSGIVPVVGSVISDASETILVSAGVMKNAAGVYGLIAILAMCIEPFLEIGIQYLLLKATAAACGIFENKGSAALIGDFTTVMGFLLAMTGTVCLLLLISTVCFMRGVS